MQLATCTKKRVHYWVRDCAFELNDMPTSTHINVLSLGSYSMLIGVDWLYLHKTKVDCYDKAIECLNDNGKKRILQGNNKLEWLKLCRLSIVIGRRVYCLQSIFLVTRVRMLRMWKSSRGTLSCNNFRMFFQHIFQILLPTGRWMLLLSWYQE